MSDFAFDFVTYLADNGFGTAGTDLWAHITPDSPDVSVSVFEFSGPPNLKTHGGIWAQRGNIQIQTRNIDVKVCAQTCASIFTFLDRKKRFSVNGFQYLYITGERSPTKLKVDERNRTYFYCEFSATRRAPWIGQQHNDSLNNWADAASVALS